MASDTNDFAITIMMSEYTRLLKAEDFLDCLNACGVNNWQGYGDAIKLYRSEDKEEDEADERAFPLHY